MSKKLTVYASGMLMQTLMSCRDGMPEKSRDKQIILPFLNLARAQMAQQGKFYTCCDIPSLRTLVNKQRKEIDKKTHCAREGNYPPFQV